jgi:hypothetical protein
MMLFFIACSQVMLPKESDIRLDAVGQVGNDAPGPPAFCFQIDRTWRASTPLFHARATPMKSSTKAKQLWNATDENT